MPNLIGRWLISLIDTGVRLSALGFIWLGTLYLALPVGDTVDFFTVYSFIVVFLVLPVALLLSHFIMQRKLLVQETPVQSRKTKSAARAAPAALATRDLLALLDADDLEDLRAEARETLRSRIQRLSEDEVASFEELLDGGGKRKRGI